MLNYFVNHQSVDYKPEISAKNCLSNYTILMKALFCNLHTQGFEFWGIKLEKIAIVLFICIIVFKKLKFCLRILI